MRVYNSRLGKFLSVDPLTKKYPMLTPYQFASNTPIQAVDLDGGEAKYCITYIDPNSKTGTSTKEMTWKEVHPQSTLDQGPMGAGTVNLYLLGNGERVDNLTSYTPTMYESLKDMLDIGGLSESGDGYDPKESTADLTKRVMKSFDTKGLLDLFDILGITPDDLTKPKEPAKPDVNSLGGNALDAATYKPDEKVVPAGQNYVEDKGNGTMIYTKDKAQKDTVKIIDKNQTDSKGNNKTIPKEGFKKGGN